MCIVTRNKYSFCSLPWARHGHGLAKFWPMICKQKWLCYFWGVSLKRKAVPFSVLPESTWLECRGKGQTSKNHVRVTTYNGKVIWQKETSILVLVTVLQPTPKLNCVKPSFYYAHKFCRSEIQTEYKEGTAYSKTSGPHLAWQLEAGII